MRKYSDIKNLIVISDTHIGDEMGLCRPCGVRTDEGGYYKPSLVVRKMWAWWKEFWTGWVPDVCRGEPFAVVLNGDALDSRHHNSVHQWTQNLSAQQAEAEQILGPVVDLCEGRYYHLRGTEAHSGPSSEQEESLAKALRAIPNECGQYARYELWVRIGHALAHITHHIGTCGSMHYESTAIMRELTEAYVEAGRWNNEAPHVVARSHRHRNAEVRVQTSQGFATAFTTPGWQLQTPFAYRIAGARMSLPQIGGSLIRCGDEDVYTRHKVFVLDRPKEVQL